MKNGCKRFLSALSALAMLVISVPMQGVLPAAAEDAPAIAEPVSTTGGMTVTGTNSLGEMLLAKSEQAEQISSGWAITDVTVEDGLVQARCYCDTFAEIVVGFYSEDGTELLASCNSTIGSSGEVTMLLPENCPENFYLKAMLLDENQIPLAKPFVTELYTSTFSEVRNAVITDYDPALTINLDEDDKTNFLVLNETTHRIESDGTANILQSVEGSDYTFINADDTLTAVQKDDILYYSDAAHEQLILKADTVTVDGTTVTLKDAGAALEDAFALIKIEYEDQAEVDTSTELPEGVTYLGEAGASAQNTTQDPAFALAKDGAEDEALELFHQERDKLKASVFKLEGECSTPESDLVSCKIEGSLEVGIAMPMTWKVYYQERRFFGRVDFDSVLFIEGVAKISAEATVPLYGFRKKCLDLAEVKADIGLRLEGEVKLTAQAKVSAPFSLFADETVFTGQTPTVSGKLEAEGSLFVGVVAELGLSVGTDEVYDVVHAGAGVGIEYKLGVQVEAQGAAEANAEVLDPTKPQPQDERIDHACKMCIDGEAKIIFTAKGEAWIRLGHSKEFMESEDFTDPIGGSGSWEKKFKKEATIAEKHLFYFYYSIDHNDWGLGECPYKKYRVRFTVTDQYGNPLPSAIVMLTGCEMRATDAAGIADQWVPGSEEDILSYNVKYKSDCKTGTLIVSRQPVDLQIMFGIEDAEPPEPEVPQITISNGGSYYYFPGYGVLCDYGTNKIGKISFNGLYYRVTFENGGVSVYGYGEYKDDVETVDRKWYDLMIPAAVCGA
ncbi:MAG: hypothetical protein J5851_04955, partial [Oscillospiraceae bacterium]|nr:hypothetical protein [Oscillospiraceae bacterium]